jgi:hypothetical protein
VITADRRFFRTISCGFSYCSSNDPSAHFGLGDATGVDAIEVRWPDGGVERFPGPGMDQTVELRRGSGEKRP